MPIGPNGEKRPADPIANALLVAKIATGEAEETYVSNRRRGGLKGDKAKVTNLSAERRSEIARKAARSRWVANAAKLDKGDPDALN